MNSQRVAAVVAANAVLDPSIVVEDFIIDAVAAVFADVAVAVVVVCHDCCCSCCCYR